MTGPYALFCEYSTCSSSHLLLAEGNGNDLHGVLQSGQGSEVQTQVVTRDTLETKVRVHESTETYRGRFTAPV